MDPTVPEWLADAWESGLNAARSMRVERTKTWVAALDPAPYGSYQWWRTQAMLAWLGAMEVKAHAKSEERREGDSE